MRSKPRYPLAWRLKAAARAFLWGLWCSVCAAVNILFQTRANVAGVEIALIDHNGNTINPEPKPPILEPREASPQTKAMLAELIKRSQAPEPVVHPLPKQILDGREVVGSVIVPGEPFYSEYIHTLMETPGKRVKIHEGRHYVLNASGGWFRLDPIRKSPGESNEFEGGLGDL